MKLIIQIPCFNEEFTLEGVLKELPLSIRGVEQIEYQIIDDGSTDNTAALAKHLGVNHIVRIGGKNRRWLGRAFRAGVQNALENGADILVNTDGDNQYFGSDIERLIEPILREQADIVIGNRQPEKVAHFSNIKRMLQYSGNKVVGFLAGEPVPDSVSGFRAFNKSALLNINVFSNYSYTIDSLVQAIHKGLKVVWIPIQTNLPLRPSRLFSNLVEKVFWSALIILRLAIVHQPFRFFAILGILNFCILSLSVILAGNIFIILFAIFTLACFVLAVICDQISLVRNLVDSGVVHLNYLRFGRKD